MCIVCIPLIYCINNLCLDRSIVFKMCRMCVSEKSISVTGFGFTELCGGRYTKRVGITDLLSKSYRSRHATGVRIGRDFCRVGDTSLLGLELACYQCVVIVRVQVLCTTVRVVLGPGRPFPVNTVLVRVQCNIHFFAVLTQYLLVEVINYVSSRDITVFGNKPWAIKRKKTVFRPFNSIVKPPRVRATNRILQCIRCIP